MGHILQAKGIHKSYTMGKQTLTVLRGVEMSLSAGDFAVIIGASGSGKSTLLHILGALDKPDKGTIEFEGQRLDQMSNSRLNQFRNQNVGFVFQFYHLLDELNVLENVILPAMIAAGPVGWLKCKKNVQNKAISLLERMGLKDRLPHKPYELSGGERQRAAIARALINGPRLLLADEPTGNLDSKTGHGILEVLNELNQQGQTILMVTHDDRIARQAGRVIKLSDGKIVS
ncbi:MAG TPA: ABC transporter ATP-binding protein [Anaerohalosphaeraceae bacterium]|nr:ABC transporter ATP-binding protein [Anaerohalosphaeraceae bacterium]